MMSSIKRQIQGTIQRNKKHGNSVLFCYLVYSHDVGFVVALFASTF